MLAPKFAGVRIKSLSPGGSTIDVERRQADPVLAVIDPLDRLLAARTAAYLLDRGAAFGQQQDKGELLFGKSGSFHGHGPSQGSLAGKLSFNPI